MRRRRTGEQAAEEAVDETQLIDVAQGGDPAGVDETQLIETLPEEPGETREPRVSWVGAAETAASNGEALEDESTGAVEVEPEAPFDDEESTEVPFDGESAEGDEWEPAETQAPFDDEESEEDFDVLALADREVAFEDAPDEDDYPEPMRQLVFVDVSLVLPATHPVVVLQEAEAPYRELRIPVGGAEGVAIAYAARKVETPRPLTHEMVSQLLDAFDVTLDSVRITAMNGSNFQAELVLSGRGGVRTLDCRPSDAIALALRRSLPVPIMAAIHVLEIAGDTSPSAN